MVYRPIVATLGYILSSDAQKVLMIHRNACRDDEHFGKYNGLGGKLEFNEDIVTGMKREISEEAGIECTRMEMRGTVNWTGFGKNGEDWFGFIFLIRTYTGIPFLRNKEGDLIWVELSKIHELPMWEGDKYFLPLVFDNNPLPFHGYMPYLKGRPKGWSYQRSNIDPFYERGSDTQTA